MAVIFAAIIVIGISFVGWMYHRRRVADLKNEIAQVQYIAEPVSPPGNFFTSCLKISIIEKNSNSL